MDHVKAKKNKSDVLRLPDAHKSIINHLIRKFKSNSNVESIFLFGSCAKGFVTGDSDIDILVVTKNRLDDDSQEAFEILYDSTDDIPLKDYISCDILIAAKEDFMSNTTPLIRIIKREGIEMNGLL